MVRDTVDFDLSMARDSSTGTVSQVKQLEEQQDSLEELLVRAQPQLGRVLARYNIPPEDAEGLLRDVFLTLIFKRERVADLEQWVLRTLKHQCLSYWRRRRRLLYTTLDSELRQTIANAAGDPEQQARLSQQLARVVDTLSGPCRRVLRQRYGLAGAEAVTPADGGAEVVAERCLAALGKRLMESGVIDDLSRLS